MDGRRGSHGLTGLACGLAGLALALSAGCSGAPRDTHLTSPYPRTRVVAVAPFINQSGSRDVEKLIVSDLFFSELQMVRNFHVLPIDRSLQAMEALRMGEVRSPADAVRLAEAMGADLIFVGAITAYDPYDPPTVGLTVQLYAVPGRGLDGGPRIDPASGVAAPAGPGPAVLPRAQVSEMYNARHEIVQKQIREFADIRGGKDSPLGWRLYSKSIQEYLRFCCYRSIRQVLQLEEDQIWLADRGRN